MDKSEWQAIIDRGYQIDESDNIDVLTEELLGYLSSPDAELRDTIAYSIFARWIITHQYYSDKQQINLIERLMPMLSHELGNHDDDTVFGRSYAALVLSLLAYQEDRSSYMYDSLARNLLDEARNYLIGERDRRAYVDGKGWANACSNTADLLKFMVRNPIIEAKDARLIMDTVAEKVIMQSDYIYHHDEDERLAQVVLAVMDLGLLTTYELEDWVKHFQDWKASHTLDGDYNVTVHSTYQNIKNFLRSVYIQMQLVDSIPIDAADFETTLIAIIAEFSL